MQAPEATMDTVEHVTGNRLEPLWRCFLYMNTNAYTGGCFVNIGRLFLVRLLHARSCLLTILIFFNKSDFRVVLVNLNLFGIGIFFNSVLWCITSRLLLPLFHIGCLEISLSSSSNLVRNNCFDGRERVIFGAIFFKQFSLLISLLSINLYGIKVPSFSKNTIQWGWLAQSTFLSISVMLRNVFFQKWSRAEQGMPPRVESLFLNRLYQSWIVFIIIQFSAFILQMSSAS